MSLLRSTKFMRYFAGAARTLILNSAKTAETSLLVNSKASSIANSILLQDYATTKKAESLEPMLQKLDSEVRRVGRISKRDIDEVFEEIRTRNDITSSQSLIVIRCCGQLVPEELPEHRTQLVQKIWSVLTDIGVPMDISHYNALLRVYIENEHPFSPAAFLDELEKKGLQPNRVTYQRLMWRYCQEGDVEGATRVLEKMRELGFPVSEPVLNALVMGHAFQGDTDGAKAVLETMAGAGLQPTNKTYALLASGFAKKGDIESVHSVIKTANEKDAFMTNKDILDIIEMSVINGHGDKIESLFGYLQKGPSYNQDACNVILRLINKGHEESAKLIMKTMPKADHVEDTSYKGAFFVKQLLRQNKSPEEIIKTCYDLQEQGLVPSALFIATESALQSSSVELAQSFLSEMKKTGGEIRQHYYWPLLVRKGKEGDEESILHILRNMSSEGLVPSGETLRDYVLPYLKCKDNAPNVIVKLQIANVPVIHSARNMMLHLLDIGKIQEAAQIAQMYRPFGQYNLLVRPLTKALGRTKDIKSFVSILHIIGSRPNATEEQSNDEPSEENGDADISRIVKGAIKRLSNPDLCDALLSELLNKGIRITVSTAQEIEQYLAENLTADISKKLAQLTASDLEMLPLDNVKRRGVSVGDAAQLERMLEQNSDSARKVRLQKQLLNAYIKQNNVDKVDSFLKDLQADNFELNSATLAQLFEFYSANDQIEKALQCQKTLTEKYPDFALNKFKLVELAHSLVRNNRIDEAIEYIKNNKVDKVNDNDFIVNSKCWQMLNLLAEKKETEKVTQMTQALLDNGYIEVSNVLLGPSIKAHIVAEDIDGALKQFERCCKEYRSTPWKGELMKVLILKEDATKLQWLADLSTQIHGEVNILHDLVLAFIECGRLKQARRILETPGLHTKQKRLEDACQRYVQEGKSEHLEGLLEATKELLHVDRTNIFYHLLVTYCKADETDKALGLWSLLQEEGEVPSEEFLRHLGKHLQSKGRTVPFVIPKAETKPEKRTAKRDQSATETSQSTPRQERSKTEMTRTIENLIKDGKAPEAMDFVIQAMQQNNPPKSNVLKFLLKHLAQEGNVEKIQSLDKYLDNTMKRSVTYDDKLTLAIFNRGNGGNHVEAVYKSAMKAKSNEELEEALRNFPRSNALASVIQNDELISKCQQVVELAASKGIYTPANLLWMEYILADKDKQADHIWQTCLANAPSIVYRRLMQEAHVNNQPEKVEKLLNCLKGNKNIQKETLANVYSRMINLYVSYNNVDSANKALDRALADGVAINQITKNTLRRLKTLVESNGEQFKYDV